MGDSMSAQFLWENYFRPREKDDIFALLKRLPIFESLSQRQLRLVERILHRRNYLEGEKVFQEGDSGSAMYIIESGEVVMHAGKSEQEIARLHDGDFFGEISLLVDQPRSATARTVRDTKLIAFSQPDLLSLLETQPRLGIVVVMQLARILAERLQHATVDNRVLHDRLAEFGQ